MPMEDRKPTCFSRGSCLVWQIPVYSYRHSYKSTKQCQWVMTEITCSPLHRSGFRTESSMRQSKSKSELVKNVFKHRVEMCLLANHHPTIKCQHPARSYLMSEYLRTFILAYGSHTPVQHICQIPSLGQHFSQFDSSRAKVEVFQLVYIDIMSFSSRATRQSTPWHINDDIRRISQDHGFLPENLGGMTFLLNMCHAVRETQTVSEATGTVRD